jgi:hypothetical protein
LVPDVRVWPFVETAGLALPAVVGCGPIGAVPGEIAEEIEVLSGGNDGVGPVAALVFPSDITPLTFVFVRLVNGVGLSGAVEFVVAEFVAPEEIADAPVGPAIGVVLAPTVPGSGAALGPVAPVPVPLAAPVALPPAPAPAPPPPPACARADVRYAPLQRPATINKVFVFIKRFLPSSLVLNFRPAGRFPLRSTLRRPGDRPTQKTFVSSPESASVGSVHA